VSSTVHQLWGKSTSLTSVAGTEAAAQGNAATASAPVSAPVSAPLGLGLFSDPDGTFSG
jgi:hypothetical protein